MLSGFVLQPCKRSSLKQSYRSLKLLTLRMLLRIFTGKVNQQVNMFTIIIVRIVSLIK